MSKARRVLTVISLIILIAALLFVAYKLFQVRKITVLGCETFDAAYVATLSEIEEDQSIFLIDTEEVLELIDTEPCIKPVEVEIIYPDKVVIHVEERYEAAYVIKDGVTLVIDEECVLLSAQNGEQSGYTPLVYGLKMDEFVVGKRLGVSEDFQLEVLSSILVQMNESELSLQSIDVTWPANIIVQTADGFSLELGDDTGLEEKLALATAAMIELNQRGMTGGVLDVSSADSAYYRQN